MVIPQHGENPYSKTDEGIPFGMTVITIDQLGLKTSPFLFTMWDEFVVTMITCCVEIEIEFVRKEEIKR